jgi:hypothetical protein
LGALNSPPSLFLNSPQAVPDAAAYEPPSATAQIERP